MRRDPGDGEARRGPPEKGAANHVDWIVRTKVHARDSNQAGDSEQEKTPPRHHHRQGACAGEAFGRMT
jgi:hypothetical protein